MPSRRYLARHHSLPKKWSELMSRKNWATISEETLHNGTAGLNFLRRYVEDDMGSRGTRLSHGCFSKFAVELCILCRVVGNAAEYHGFCLGNGIWGALFWPLCLHKEGEFEGYYLDPNGEAEWVHVLQPEEWHVLVHEAVVHKQQIFMVPKSEQPLLQFFLQDRTCRNSLTVADLTMLAEIFNLSKDEFDAKKMNKEKQLLAILQYVGRDSKEWCDKVTASLSLPAEEKKIGDSLDELILSDMGQEDQRDYKDIGDEIDSRRKAGWTLLCQRWRKATEKKRQRSKNRKGHPKAKAGKFALRSKKRKAPEPDLPASPPAVVEAIQNGGESPDGPLPGDAVEAEPEPAKDIAMEVSDEMTLQEVKDLVCQQQPAEAAAEAPVPPPLDPPPAPAPSQPRIIAGRRAETLDWTDVMCSYCHSQCGQIKYDPNPGNREPIWVMRVKEANGEWPTQGKNFRRRLTRLIGESPEGATKWCRSQRTCCQTNKEVDFPLQKAGK
eukprot:s167_g12.t1